MSEDPDTGTEGPGPLPPSVPRRQVVTHRRAPRYRAFGFTGAVAGAVVGVVLALSRPADDGFSLPTLLGYFATAAALIGVLSGLGAAVLVERSRERNTR